jgi:hypothetical protein
VVKAGHIADSNARDVADPWFVLRAPRGDAEIRAVYQGGGPTSWAYENLSDARDYGTVVEFAERHGGAKEGDAAKTLSEWVAWREDLRHAQDHLDLPTYACTLGYEVAEANQQIPGARGAVVLESAARGERVLFTPGSSSEDVRVPHRWCYARIEPGPGAARDRGGVIEFAKTRGKVEPTRLRWELLDFMGREALGELRVAKDTHHNCDVWVEAGLRKETVDHSRFRGTFETSGVGKAPLFLHRDTRYGFVGFEEWFKDEGLQKIEHGARGIWVSGYTASDRKVVVTRSPLEAMAYQQAKRSTDTRYVAIGTLSECGERKAQSLAGTLAVARNAQLVLAASVGDDFQDLRKRLPSLTWGVEKPPVGRSWMDVGPRERAGAQPDPSR